MRRFLPRFAAMGASLSDNNGADADGVCISVEWLGVILEVTLARRARGPGA